MTTEEATERRLAFEAKTHIGALCHPDIPKVAGKGGYAEVLWVEADGTVRAGRFHITVPIYADPWLAIRELVDEELDRRGAEHGWESWEVSDIYSS